MKKLISLILALCLVLSFAGCGSEKQPAAGETTEAQSAQEQPTEAQPSEERPAETQAAETQPAAEAVGYTFTYKGTQIAMKADAEPILAALGEPNSYTEEASCAFDGLDKTYSYGSFYLTTYPEGGKDYVYRIWFADDGVTTEEGVYIGAAQAEVESAYGADSFNGSNAYILTKDGTSLTVILKDGAVSSIQYEAVLA